MDRTFGLCPSLSALSSLYLILTLFVSVRECNADGCNTCSYVLSLDSCRCNTAWFKIYSTVSQMYRQRDEMPPTTAEVSIEESGRGVEKNDPEAVPGLCTEASGGNWNSNDNDRQNSGGLCGIGG
jgi:hypothetical protein